MGFEGIGGLVLSMPALVESVISMMGSLNPFPESKLSWGIASLETGSTSVFGEPAKSSSKSRDSIDEVEVDGLGMAVDVTIGLADLENNVG